MSKILGKVINCLKNFSFKTLLLKRKTAHTITKIRANGKTEFLVKEPSSKNMNIRRELLNLFGSCKYFTRKYIAAVQKSIAKLSQLIEEERNTNIKVLDSRKVGSICPQLLFINLFDNRYTKDSVPRAVRILTIRNRKT